MENEVIASISSGQSIVTIIITAITVLTSSAAWNFWIKRMELRSANKQKEIENNEKNSSELKESLKERLSLLEAKLEKAEERNGDLQTQIINLVEKIATLRVEVEFLRKENELLKNLSITTN